MEGCKPNGKRKKDFRQRQRCAAARMTGEDWQSRAFERLGYNLRDVKCGELQEKKREWRYATGLR
jgi:hypothetical protein